MTAEITQELAVRMAALVRNIVNYEAVDDIEKPLADEARAIVALLPEPVDPDLVECREILACEAETKGWTAHALRWRAGAWDDESTIISYMKVLKRGRELALKAREGES